MTTNQERAAEVLREVFNEFSPSVTLGGAERVLASRLADAGLLAPDPQPRPEDAPDGYYLVRWWGEEHPVPAEKVQGQWWVIGKPSMLPAKDVLIVSRLIPEGEQA